MQVSGVTPKTSNHTSRTRFKKWPTCSKIQAARTPLLLNILQHLENSAPKMVSTSAPMHRCREILAILVEFGLFYGSNKHYNLAYD